MFLGLVLELLQQVPLALGEMPGRLDGDLDVHVAAGGAAQDREALAAQAELVAGLGACGNFHLRAAAVDGGHLHIAAKRGLRHGQGDAAVDVGAVPLEDLVRGDGDVHEEVAGWGSSGAGLALAGQADTGAFLDAGGDCDLKRALALHRASTVADAAGVLDDPAGAAAGGTGSLDKKEALLRPDLAGTVAGGAGIAAGVFAFGAGAVAGVTGDAGGNAKLALGASEGLREVNFDLRLQVGARALATAAAAGEVAEHLVEDVAEAGAIAERVATALLKGLMAKPVVGAALLFVFQDVVGFIHLLELRLRGLVAGVAVGVILHGHLAVGLFQVIRAGVLGDAQGGIEVRFGCHVSPQTALQEVQRKAPASE